VVAKLLEEEVHGQSAISWRNRDRVLERAINMLEDYANLSCLRMINVYAKHNNTQPRDFLQLDHCFVLAQSNLYLASTSHGCYLPAPKNSRLHYRLPHE
jgi:hypothetical protein